MDSPSIAKRPLLNDDGPPSKKLKPLPEVPAQYSDAVRKKLAQTSRTGQACDRCKERKMKCDTDPVACQPCRQKSLRCFTTDRVTGHSRERGQTDRAENEINFLREQLTAYQRRYGSLHPDDFRGAAGPSPSEIAGSSRTHTPSSHYVGWPAPDDIEPLHTGPVNGTKIDILDGVIDVADFDCPMMQDPPSGKSNVFNLSRKSLTDTIFRYQRVEDPRLPPKEEAVKEANHFLVVMSQYVPIVHRPSFIQLVNQFYDHPNSLTVGERVQVLVMLAIMTQQGATRNHRNSAEKFEDSHRYLHHALGFYGELYQSRSLSAMQAMAFLIIHFRNLPKPGVSWTYAHKVLIRAIEMEYHRDPDKIQLPPEENNPLSKELRKRIFHTILGVCVTTGCRVGRPAPWQFQHVDVPLPAHLKDSEISVQGITKQLSGSCDYLPSMQLAKLLPLLTELYNHIISVRRPAHDYLKTVETLNNKIIAWRQDWEDSIRLEQKHINISVATLLIETWAAEYQLNLHHPVCCTSTAPDVIERNLDMCHKSAKRLLQAFHTLSNRYKGVDFTWHSTAAYAMGFGITLHIHRRRLGSVTKEQFETICNELNGWMSLMAYADLVLRTDNHLQRIFKPRVQAVEDSYRSLMAEPTYHQPTSQNGFLPVNSTHMKSQIKSEPSPQTTPLSSAPASDMDANQTPNSSVPPNAMNAPLQTGSSGSVGWPPRTTAPLQYMPPSTLATGYPSNASTGPPPPPPPHFQPIPTSLAPLLNDPNGMYVNYPTPPQTQTIGPISDSMMAFSPNHYYDTQAAMMWPLITMPPNGQ